MIGWDGATEEQQLWAAAGMMRMAGVLAGLNARPCSEIVGGFVMATLEDLAREGSEAAGSMLQRMADRFAEDGLAEEVRIIAKYFLARELV